MLAEQPPGNASNVNAAERLFGQELFRRLVMPIAWIGGPGQRIFIRCISGDPSRKGAARDDSANGERR